MKEFYVWWKIGGQWVQIEEEFVDSNRKRVMERLRRTPWYKEGNVKVRLRGGV